MIANILNCLVGLALTYVAIFGMPASAKSAWLLAAGGVVIVILALLARPRDYSGWQSATNIVLGIVLVLVSVIDSVTAVISPLVMFWMELWVGLTVASLALWAALYHPADEPAVSAE